MPTITFRPQDASIADVYAAIEAAVPGIAVGSVRWGNGRAYYVELPTATQPQADAIEAALRAQFPRETSTDWLPVALPFVLAGAAPVAWTNMPAAATELFGLQIHRRKFSLAPFKQARLNATVSVVGVAGAEIGLQASLDGAAWQSLAGVANGVSLVIGIATAGFKESALEGIAAALRTDVFLRLVGRNGNGVADPSFGVIELQAR